MDKIAIIYTTFLRDRLMKQTLTSILQYWQENYTLLVGNQNKTSADGLRWSFSKEICNWKLPYDCGLSYARNYLIQKAHEMGIKYCLVTADSIQFTEKYDFQPVIDFLESDPNYCKVGFNIENRQNFTYDLDISKVYNKFIVKKTTRSPILANNTPYIPCDMCCNFFMAKTEHLVKIPYDNDLKLCEHEDHCYRLKQAGFKTFWTPYINSEYINDKPDEYKQMRNRLYTEFRGILKKKYGFDPEGSWLVYNHKLPKEKQE